MSESAAMDPDMVASIQYWTRELREGASPQEFLDDLVTDLYWFRSLDLQVHAQLLLPLFAEALDRAGGVSRYPAELETVLARLGPTVATLLHHRQAGARCAGLAGLAARRQAAEEPAVAVVALLADADSRVRGQACRALAVVRPTRDSARAIARCLSDSCEEVVAEAILALGRLGEEAAEHELQLVPFLNPELCQRNVLCYNALQALAKMPGDMRLLPHFRALLRLEWERACSKALPCLELDQLVTAVGSLGPAARECVSDLERLLRASKESIGVVNTIAIAIALIRIEEDNEFAVRALEQCASSTERDDRWFVVLELLDAPAYTRVRVRSLIEKLAKDPDEAIREKARGLLGRKR